MCPVAVMVVLLKGWAAEECTHLWLWNELSRTDASGLVDANETRLLLPLFSVAGLLEREYHRIIVLELLSFSC